MPSTASTRVRAELIGEFEKTNAWATSLNAALSRLDDAIGQFTTIALSGDTTLTVANFITDQARSRTLRFTGTGTFTVTAPAVSYWYIVQNDCTGNVTLTPSGGTGAVIRPGRRAIWYTDGTTGYVLDPSLDQIRAPAASVSLNSQKIVSLATPTDATDAATKGYVDTLPLSSVAAPSASVNLNSQKIINLATPTDPADGATKGYVDGRSLSNFGVPTGNISFGNFKLINLATPTDPADGATKGYVDGRSLSNFGVPTGNISFSGFKLTNLADGSIGTQDAATVAQVQSLLASAVVNVPAQTGQAGKYLRTNGTVVSWEVSDEFAIHALG